MNPWMAVPFKTRGKFNVGDRVRFIDDRPGQTGEVVEDRGPIGMKGRRIYRVSIREDEWNVIESEYPEEILELVECGSAKNGKPK